MPNSRFLRATVSTVILFSLAAAPAVGLAQSNTASTTKMGASTAKVDAHIHHLRAKLKITAAQEPQWKALAAVMRENAQSMDQLYDQRTQNVSSMTAVEVLKSYRDFTKAHLTALNHLVPAFTKLYDVLSASQKQIADTLFQNRAIRATARKTHS